MLIDTHAHIYTDAFGDDREMVIQEAVGKGIGKILMPNIDVASLPDVLRVAEQFPSVCYPMNGLHPTSVNQDYKRQLDILAEAYTRNSFIGVGEIGIDLYWDKTFLEQQKDAFREQLKIARSLKLPAIIHVRESFNEVYSILSEEQDGTLKGIFHCFSGSASDAQKVIDIGFFLGIGGVVTYKNSQLTEVLQHTDISKIVLETDAPWLAPVPYRGKRNECIYLIYTAQKVAEIYGLSLEEITSATTRNALEIFTFD
jgi:TatD DNase family protein